MATRWFQKQGGREIGPFGFQELAAMLRAGTLHEDDRVRMEHGTQWIAARDVLGLLRTAGTVQTAGGSAIRATEGEAASPRPEDRITIPPAAGEEAPSAEVVREGIQIPRLKIGISLRTAKGITGGFSHPSPCPLPVGERVQRAVIPFAVLRHPRRPLYAIVGLSLVAALATTVWALWQRPPIRPRDRTHAAQAPRPEIPSVPTLKENVATLVPGLEDVQDPYSPCLTANLRTIIFAAALGPGNGHHLCVAERGSASEPFGAARLIRGCASEAIDEYPSLTADGLELVFARREPGSQTGTQFYYSRRDAATREFGDAALGRSRSSPAWTRRSGKSNARSYSTPCTSCSSGWRRPRVRGTSLWPSGTAGRTGSPPCGNTRSTTHGRPSALRRAGCAPISATRRDFSSAHGGTRRSRLAARTRSSMRALRGPSRGRCGLRRRKTWFFTLRPGQAEPGSGRKLWLVRIE